MDSMDNNPAGDTLVMCVIYDHPRDHPDHYVLRAWYVTRDGVGPAEDVVLADSLDEVRQYVPDGLLCLARQHDDDPAIVETWL